MRPSLVSTLLIAALASTPAFAVQDNTAETDYSLPSPALSLGFSYPLIFSLAVGAFLPLGKQDKNSSFPTSPSLRVDAEVGLGGGSAAVGMYVPFGEGSFALNIKAVRMRTWLFPWNVEANRTYDGAVLELVALGHVPGKIGLGYFQDTDPNNRRAAFTHVFIGVGW